MIPVVVLCMGNVFAADSLWNAPNNGNPIIPGYFADPSIMYDSAGKTFYVYSTTDGVYITWSAQPSVWYTTDLIHWNNRQITLPSFWPKTQLWAPSILKHPVNGKYYLMYCIGNAAYMAYSSTPLGPWTNAVANNAVLYSSGQLTGSSDWIDPQFFVDTNTVYITFGQSSVMGIARLKFDTTTFLASFDNSDARMTNGVTYKCKLLSGLTNSLEGSCMFKKDGRYFMSYSNNKCQNYNVQYAVASSPVGPFAYVNKIILARDNADSILGPGHHSILHYGNNWYIFYHRQPYQYVDIKRESCMDQITFKGDTITAGAQTNAGLWAGTGSLESLVAASRALDEKDLAYGKPTLASSESNYKGGTGNSEVFAAKTRFYKAKYAVDHNYGTRWAPDTTPGWLAVDLGADYALGRTKTTFEYVLRNYRYKIEYLAASEAANLAVACSLSTWHMFANRAASTDTIGITVDSNKVTARYMKLTVISFNQPSASYLTTIDQTDYHNRVSVIEFQVFNDAITNIVPVNKHMGGINRVNGLSYELASPGLVQIKVVNAAGIVVLNRTFNSSAGMHTVAASSLSLSKGVYFGVLSIPGNKNSSVVPFVKQ